jgi:hypothetical protein
MDISFNEAGHICKYQGESVFKGLVTGSNEIGEVRISRHLLTEARDQIDPVLKDFADTEAAHGRPSLQHAITDNPMRDKKMFLDRFPSLQLRQSKFDTMSEHGEFDNPLLPVCHCEPSEYTLLSTTNAMNSVADSLRESLEDKPLSKRVLFVDIEWEMGPDFKKWKDKTAMIQIRYKGHAYLNAVHPMLRLPDRMDSLLLDKNVKLVGKCIRQDMGKVWADFRCAVTLDVKQGRHLIDIAHMSADRGVSFDKTVGLKKLFLILLCEDLPKDLGRSKWAGHLYDSMLKYAALDVIKPEQMYDHLVELPNLTARLSTGGAIIGMHIFVAPYRWNLASVAAHGKIIGLEQDVECQSPVRVTFSHLREPVAMVHIDDIYAAHLTLTGFMENVEQMRAGFADF